jgi:hypothetical protein
MRRDGGVRELAAGRHVSLGQCCEGCRAHSVMMRCSLCLMRSRLCSSSSLGRGYLPDRNL